MYMWLGVCDGFLRTISGAQDPAPSCCSDLDQLFAPGPLHCWCAVLPIGLLSTLLETHSWPPRGWVAGMALPWRAGTHLWPDCGGWFPGTCCAGASCSPRCTRPGAARRAGCPCTPGSRCARCAGTPAGSAPSPPGRWPRTWGRGAQVRMHGPLPGEGLLVLGTVLGR